MAYTETADQVHDTRLQQESDDRRTLRLRTASYAGAISAIVTGYSAAWLTTAIESTDRNFGNNTVPDKMTMYAGVSSLIVGGMGSLVLKKLNQRK